MLEVIGAAGIDELFASIPAALRESAELDLPAGLPEAEVLGRLRELQARNSPAAGFQGAGCYRHYVPAIVAAVLGRGEFATAYTPYQPEVSQGTLQACFEFQTYVSILTGLEVANASMYDGASAFAEAVLMALRIGGNRERVLVSAAVHPEYRRVLGTYLDGYGRGRVSEIAIAADGRTDLEALEAELGDDVAAVCIGYPNFFGVIDDLANASRLAKRVGALSISATTEALALGLLREPGKAGADIAVAEGQSLGLPMSYGGPGVGLFATRREFVRQMPGRLVGETIDERGRRGYVLTLATREQHIRREKATSNICTNQGLAALAVTVFLSLAGRSGLRRLAELNATAAHSVCERLSRQPGVQKVYTGPFFNEFVVQVDDCSSWFEECCGRGLIPGVPLSERLPSREDTADRILVTVTETCSESDVDVLLRSLREREAA